jgi:hypothetical protein
MSINSTGTVNFGSGSSGSLNFDLESGVSTTDATTTTVASLATSNDLKYTVEAWVIGAGTTSTIGGKVLAVFKNVGGLLSPVGIPVINVFEDFSGSPTFTLDASGTTIRLRVTGQAATNITWWGKITYVYINTAV